MTNFQFSIKSQCFNDQTVGLKIISVKIIWKLKIDN